MAMNIELISSPFLLVTCLYMIQQATYHEEASRSPQGNIPPGTFIAGDFDAIPTRLSTPDLADTQRNFFTVSRASYPTDVPEDSLPILSRQEGNYDTVQTRQRFSSFITRLNQECTSSHVCFVATMIVFCSAAISACIVLGILLSAPGTTTTAIQITSLLLALISLLLGGAYYICAWGKRRRNTAIELADLNARSEEAVTPSPTPTQDDPTVPSPVRLGPRVAVRVQSGPRPLTPFPAAAIAIPAVASPFEGLAPRFLTSAGSEGSILTQLCAGVSEPASRG
ncbi:hypothetical protein ACHAQH_003639 [Verticillium albo-atrum]